MKQVTLFSTVSKTYLSNPSKAISNQELYEVLNRSVALISLKLSL